MRRLLLQLYPRAWRERYGDEFLDLLASRPINARTLGDIVAAAVDARLHPQVAPAEEEDRLFKGFMKRCAAGGPRLDARQQWMGTAIVLAASVTFALTYVFAAYRWRGNDYVDALGIAAFPAALVFALPSTYLSGYARSTQAAIVLGTLALLVAASIGSVWLL